MRGLWGSPFDCNVSPKCFARPRGGAFNRKQLLPQAAGPRNKCRPRTCNRRQFQNCSDTPMVEFRDHFVDDTALNIKFTISKKIGNSVKVINLATPVCFVLYSGVRVERSDLCSGFCPAVYPFLPSVISNVLHVLFSV